MIAKVAASEIVKAQTVVRALRGRGLQKEKDILPEPFWKSGPKSVRAV